MVILLSREDTALRFCEIYDSTKKAALAFITAKCGNTADIGDIFQDTYLELYQVLERRGVSYVTNEKALVKRIAGRKLAKYYSLKKRLGIFASMTKTGEDGQETDMSETELAWCEADSFLTEEFAVNRIMVENAKRFIMQKPQETRKVFYLFYDVGLTIPEIAEALSISESNVKNKLYRTLKELRSLLSE